MVEESKIVNGDQNGEYRDKGQEVDGRRHSGTGEEKEKDVEKVPGNNGSLSEHHQVKSGTDREETLPVGSPEDQLEGSPELEEVEETQNLENIDNLDMVEIPRAIMESPKVQAGIKEALMEEAFLIGNFQNQRRKLIKIRRPMEKSNNVDLGDATGSSDRLAGNRGFSSKVSSGTCWESIRSRERGRQHLETHQWEIPKRQSKSVDT
ncbi:hypothetical protein L6452_35120 [Arctium lappa]|uniref:Uncharacterized protein n=1 Tax=Arctium lappa TaxID=4217 RepID=A0ACB8YJA0_ARCLA|nr:hypothetical protein L6452_35120 [Arctium lappa]